jgi:hypothetical protein
VEGSEVSEGINKDAGFRAVDSWSVLFLRLFSGAALVAVLHSVE